MLLNAQKREIKGKKVESLRKEGLIPAVLYGWNEKESQMISVDKKIFQKIWKDAGESTLIDLDIDGDKKGVLIYDVAINPLTDEPIHVDFYAAQMDKLIEAEVSIVFEGESPAVKNLGGALVKVMHEILVEALPRNLPHEVKVDLATLINFNDKILVSDIQLPEGVTINANKDDAVALVEEPRSEEEEVTEERSIEDIQVEEKGKKEEDGEESEEAKKEEPKEGEKE